jgi:hypothetical protein
MSPGFDWFEPRDPEEHTFVAPGAADVAEQMRERGDPEEQIDRFLDEHSFTAKLRELTGADNSLLTELAMDESGVHIPPPARRTCLTPAPPSGLKRHRHAVVDAAPAFGVCTTDEDVVLDRGRAIEAVRRGWLDVGELPVAAGIRARKPTEDLDPLLELSPGQLLGRAADVDGAGGSGGARRVVDRNRDLLPRFQVARMPGLMSRNPVEVAAVDRREPDGGDPRVP